MPTSPESEQSHGDGNDITPFVPAPEKTITFSLNTDPEKDRVAYQTDSEWPRLEANSPDNAFAIANLLNVRYVSQSKGKELTPVIFKIHNPSNVDHTRKVLPEVIQLENQTENSRKNILESASKLRPQTITNIFEAIANDKPDRRKDQVKKILNLFEQRKQSLLKLDDLEQSDHQKLEIALTPANLLAVDQVMFRVETDRMVKGKDPHKSCTPESKKALTFSRDSFNRKKSLEMTQKLEEKAEVAETLDPQFPGKPDEYIPAKTDTKHQAILNMLKDKEQKLKDLLKLSSGEYTGKIFIDFEKGEVRKLEDGENVKEEDFKYLLSFKELEQIHSTSTDNKANKYKSNDPLKAALVNHMGPLLRLGWDLETHKGAVGYRLGGGTREDTKDPFGGGHHRSRFVVESGYVEKKSDRDISKFTFGEAKLAYQILDTFCNNLNSYHLY